MQSTPEKPRRNFIVAFFAIVFGGAISAVPVLSGVWFFLDPLRKKNKGGAGGFVPVTTLDALPTNGEPQLFPFKQERVDAWNKYLFQGTVYLRKRSEKRNRRGNRPPQKSR